MKSIRGKFLYLSLISILLCAVLVGGVALMSVSSLQRSTAQDILSLTCRTEGEELDELLRNIQDSVEIFCDLTDARLSSLELLHNEYYVGAFFTETERSMLKIASRTRGVCACYFRTDFDLTVQQEGFFYSVRADSDELVKEPLTDLSRYNPWDTSRVGWYYQPRVAGHAIWMEPYYNSNLDLYMVSYVVPLFRDGVFWGVVGMDINFDVVLEHVRAIRPYQTGYACLVNDQGVIIHHPELPSGESITDYCPELEALVDAFSDPQSAYVHSCYYYQYQGEGKELSCYTLANGLHLLLTAKESEIKAPMMALFRFISMITLLLATAVIVFVVSASNRITRPLVKLTRAAEQIAQGNMEVELPEAGSDEVGILTHSFAVTVESLKEHIARMYEMAYSDPLTRVKNKTAYDKKALHLQEQMERGEAEFALMMLDVNNLKTMNDKYGHVRGDEYLVNCCTLMCKVFKHSPVYRVGGDEFLILLRGDDLEGLPLLLEEMDARMARSHWASEPWKRLSIAKGIGYCMPGDKSPDAVLKRADDAMYVDKRHMKESYQAIV